MTNRLHGKSVIVCDAGSELGRGIALRAASAGASLILVDRPELEGSETLAAIRGRGLSAELVEADIATPDGCAQVIAALRHHGNTLHGLVLGATPEPMQWGRLEELDIGKLDEEINRELRPAWHMMRAAASSMRVAGGSIVVVLSAFGEFASRYVSAYNAAKFAVLGLARSAAHEWGRSKIRVNGLVTAADSERFRAFAEKSPEETARRLAAYPLRRMGDAERDIGGAVVFLLSDDTKFVTGQVIHADGGAFLTRPAFEPDLPATSRPAQ